MKRTDSCFVDAARGLAALAVLFTHVEAHVLAAYADIPTRPSRASRRALVWFFYGFAHQAVVVFFVLSGFLVGLVFARRTRSAFLSAYLLDRTVRIYLVLVPTRFRHAGARHGGLRWLAEPESRHRGVSGRSSLGVFSPTSPACRIFSRRISERTRRWTLARILVLCDVRPVRGVAVVGYSSRTRVPRSPARRSCWRSCRPSQLSPFGFCAVDDRRRRGASVDKGADAIGATGARRSFRLRSAAARAALFAGREIWWIGGLGRGGGACLANLLATLRFDNGPVWRSTWAYMRAFRRFPTALRSPPAGVVMRGRAADVRHRLADRADALDALGGHGGDPVCDDRHRARLFWRVAEARTLAVRACPQSLCSAALGALSRIRARRPHEKGRSRGFLHCRSACGLRPPRSLLVADDLPLPAICGRHPP